MVEAVGHADGGLDPVVERLQAGVAAAGSDGSDDAVPAPVDLPGQIDDFGDAAVGGPEYPALQLGFGLFGGLVGACCVLSNRGGRFEVVTFSWTR